MTPNFRKIALTAHIASSVGWFGTVAGFEALAIVGLVAPDAFTMRAAYLAMEKVTWLTIVPFAFTSLITGLIMALGTKWGLFRHYWIVAKFLINTLSIALLLLHTRLIGTLARAAETGAISATDLHGQASELAVKGGAALVTLLVAMSLAVVKPRGMTAYGRRKLQASRPALQPTNVELVPAPVENRFPIASEGLMLIGGAIVLAIIILHFGGHGHH
jgi:hypothetical protein